MSNHCALVTTPTTLKINIDQDQSPNIQMPKLPLICNSRFSKPFLCSEHLKRERGEWGRESTLQVSLAPFPPGLPHGSMFWDLLEEHNWGSVQRLGISSTWWRRNMESLNPHRTVSADSWRQRRGTGDFIGWPRDNVQDPLCGKEQITLRCVCHGSSLMK